MTVFLVRHGSAGHRNGADPHDPSRTLDRKGERQATAVAERLASEGVSAILSSPYPRCVETVAPLATQLDLEVVTDDRLGEGTDVGSAWTLLESSAADNVVLCSHGDVIPDLIRRLQRRGMVINGPSGFSKGSIWTLNDWVGTHFETAAWERP